MITQEEINEAGEQNGAFWGAETEFFRKGAEWAWYGK